MTWMTRRSSTSCTLGGSSARTCSDPRRSWWRENLPRPRYRKKLLKTSKRILRQEKNRQKLLRKTTQKTQAMREKHPLSIKQNQKHPPTRISLNLGGSSKSNSSHFPYCRANLVASVHVSSSDE